MPLHLMKLCVGVDSLEELRECRRAWLREPLVPGFPRPPYHTTRSMPKRREELLDGGSLYWIIRGWMRARQELVDIVPFEDGEGMRRCHLVLAPELIATVEVPHRPFQGWRYLRGADAPPDADAGLGEELARLGL